MGMDRFLIFLSALCVVFAAETTLDLASTTIISTNTEVTEQIVTTTSRTEKKSDPTTDTPLDNEIEVEERATSAAIRTTEEVPQIKELPTTKLESTTVEAKEILDNDLTTTASPSPGQATERSSSTTENKETTESVSQRLTTPPTSQGIVTITPSTTSQRPKKKKNKIRQKLTTTTTPPAQGAKTEEILQRRPVASNILQEVTTKPWLSRPDRKSTVEAKKGTINAGALHQPKRRKPSKKDNGMSSLMYIPLMIQAQMIPMMIMQLKFWALKALAIGKLALIILGLNLLRNAVIGYHNDEQQYEQESLASTHYGYNGGPEYGSWVNRRMYRADPTFTIQKQSPLMESRRNKYAYARLNKPQSRFSNNPYRGYENPMLTKTR
ncbi:chondroitin proteoglycan 1 [Halyomorpha halys]|uniref:chondroitin proteoglycan 1 n=1 Tax=Halyomorpha halys TaxID=286706 RepID=UPI0006D4D557|nr:uncharacterized protein LOC106689743 [Halyomorpha halys]